MISQLNHSYLQGLCHAAALVQDIEADQLIGIARTEAIATARQLVIYLAAVHYGVPRVVVSDYLQLSEGYISQVIGNVTLVMENRMGCRQITYKARAIDYLFSTELKWKGRL